MIEHFAKRCNKLTGIAIVAHHSFVVTLLFLSPELFLWKTLVSENSIESRPNNKCRRELVSRDVRILTKILSVGIGLKQHPENASGCLPL